MGRKEKAEVAVTRNILKAVGSKFRLAGGDQWVGQGWQFSRWL
jgi:hypothetical protein